MAGMTVLFVIVAIAVIAGVGMAAAGRFGGMPDAPAAHRPAQGADGPVFDVVLRGYRMDEVDAVIDDLRGQIADLRGERR